jgi:poly(hydroxyalkanoate) depolymerase family esterase
LEAARGIPRAYSPVKQRVHAVVRKIGAMARRTAASIWAKTFQRSFTAATRHAVRSGSGVMREALKPAIDRHKPPPGEGDWIAGVAMGTSGARRYRLYRPPGIAFGERLPMMVMLHGCGQDARSFAMSTRMNRIAARERFLVLYPEQDRLANPQGCWNWFDTRSGRAQGEAALIMRAIDQVCLFYPVDRSRIALAGLSAGASMAALLVTRHPERFKAVVMHSGVPPGMAHSGASALSAMHGHRAARPLPAAPSTPTASPAAWPPLMVIHGGADRVVSSSNAHTAVQSWADAAGARPSKQRSVQRGKRHAMNITDYKRQGAMVATLVEVAELGHAWSGGAARQPYSDARGPDASRMAWAFAAKRFDQSTAAPAAA